MKISATTVAHSISPQGKILWTGLLTFPRFILAELNTHRMLSKNSASSRAIPTHKLLKMVEENPFIPIAWQKEHKGMQGTEYITNELEVANLNLWQRQSAEIACNRAKWLTERGATKQIANRLLEPFMWHTVLISGTEWENFFELRCPQYGGTDGRNNEVFFRSRKDALKHLQSIGSNTSNLSLDDTLGWLKVNKGQAEIHMMALAEAIWDAMNESKPKQLKDGEWHIPFEDKIDDDKLEDVLRGPFRASYIRHDGDKEQAKIEVSTAMAARTSYTIVGDEKEVSYGTLLGIHDKMAVAKPFHASPFEHCARAMDNREYEEVFAGNDEKEDGYCRNFQGFIQYRHIIEKLNNKI